MNKNVNGTNEQDQVLMEKATEIIHNSIEAKLDHSTYIRTYGEIQDDVIVLGDIEGRLVKRRVSVNCK